MVAICALVLADLVWVNAGANPTFDPARVFPPTRTTDLLRSLPPGRVLVAPGDLESNRTVEAARTKIVAPPNTLLPYAIPAVTGKNQLLPRWYQEFAALIEPQPHLSHLVFDSLQSPYFDLLNVRYVLTRAAAPAPDGLRLHARVEGVALYENPAALPRAFLARRAVEAGDAAAALRALRDPDFEPRATVVLAAADGEPVGSAPPAATGAGPSPAEPHAPGSATITVDRRNQVTIVTEANADAWLVLSDKYYPGWRASVDGQAVPVRRANHTMRAVPVAQGRHVVSFEFAPASFRTGVLISLATAALAAATLLASVVRGSREEAAA
jgi:Bacterial membrane protein YfhO